MSSRIITRGQPLLVLLLLMSSWVSARVMNNWSDAMALTPSILPAAPSGMPDLPGPLGYRDIGPTPSPSFVPQNSASVHEPAKVAIAAPTSFLPTILNDELLAARTVAHIGWMDVAGLSRGPSGNSHPLRTVLGGALPSMIGSEISRELPESPHRWALSGWAFLRQNSDSIPVGQARYGGSQAGIIARFLTDPESEHAPTLFARATYAFDDRSDRDLALGASIRPLPKVPVRIAAERRFALGEGGRDRTVISAITEIPPARLPAGVTAEIYAQAGIAGLSRKQEFFDLAAVGEKKVAQIGPKAEMHVGAGVWAAGQNSDYRVDAGPRTSVRFPVGDGNARIAVDYRAQVAGNVEPGSGVAVTLAHDF